MNRFSGTLASLVVAVLVAGCDLEFESQDVVIRHDAANDAVDVLLVYHGISAGGGEPKVFGAGEPNGSAELERALAAFDRIAAGEREGMIVDWPLYASLDAWRAEDAKALTSSERSEDEKQAARERLALQEFVALVDHAAFLDAKGRLCGFQRVRIAPWSKFEAALNDVFDRVATAEAQRRGDDEGAAARGRKAAAGTPWLAFGDGALHVDVPLSRAERAEAWRTICADTVEPEGRAQNGAAKGAGFLALVAEWGATASSIELDDAGLRVEMGDRQTPIHWRIDCADRPYDAALLEALRAKGVRLRENVKVEDLIAAMQ